MRQVLEKIKTLPEEPGVYLFRDKEDKILYIGKSKNIRTRVKQYFIEGRDSRAMIPHLTAQIEEIETYLTLTEKQALLLENTLIKKHKPKYNALLKDDKTFIGIEINTSHPFPALRLVRLKGNPRAGVRSKNRYFGPYTSGFAAKQTVELLNRLFPLRECSDKEIERRKSPCILYAMKRCSAPCVQKTTQKEYTSYVKAVIDFIEGKDKEIVDDFTDKMYAASEKLEFEKAAIYHQIIKQIEEITANAKSAMVGVKDHDCDLIYLYMQSSEAVLMQMMIREGAVVAFEPHSFSEVIEDPHELIERFLIQKYAGAHRPPKKILTSIPLENSEEIEEIIKIDIKYPRDMQGKALLALALKNAKNHFDTVKDHEELKSQELLNLQKTLNLTRFPENIECFDVSNIKGSDTVAAKICYIGGTYNKKGVRLYKLKAKENDYAALKEALERRFIKSKDPFPDLLLVDGGKGHLKVAMEVFEKCGVASVDLASVTKERGRHDKGMSQERVFKPESQEPIILPLNSPLLFLIQRIRDEAHRVAITFHRKRRSKRLLPKK